jgi:hypothetical protein
MLCGLTQWVLSRRMDTGKSLPFWADRHLERCRTCQNFRELGRSLEAFAEIPGRIPLDDELNQRILDRFDNLSSSPVERPFSRSFGRKPVLIAASLVFVLVLGMVWLSGPFRSRSLALGGFKDVDLSPIRQMILEMETPYEDERSTINQGLETMGAKIKEFFNTRFSE